MSFLRSSLLLTLVYLSVLTGYSAQVFGLCCERLVCEQTQQVKASSIKTAFNDADDCQCLCHQVIPDPASKPLRVAAVNFLSIATLLCGDQYPPDSLPLGIDYPPQLS